MTPRILSALGILFLGILIADTRGFLRTSVGRVGQITETSGTVRRMVAKQLTWDFVTRGIEVGRLDAIATEGNGSARIRLDAGSDIALGPNSMVLLEETPGRLILHLLRGAPRIRALKTAPKPLVIRAVIPSPAIQEVESLDGPSVPSPEPKKEVDEHLRTRTHPVRIK